MKTRLHPIEVIVETYTRTKSVWKAGEQLGISGQSVSARLKRAGVKSFQAKMTDDDRKVIKEYYENTPAEIFDLNILANQLGRTRQLICRRAREMGLTDKGRVHNAEVINRLAVVNQDLWKRKPHPRGALGYKHKASTLRKLSELSRNNWASLTEDCKAERVVKQLRTKVAKYGCIAPNVKRGTWRAGWREIGCVRKYFRSRWEANYARYLEWLRGRGEIADWQHEPQTFWFEAVKRGVRSYLPDFKVIENDGTASYHEVKGWFDARSKTTIKRMAKYHPTVKLVVIDSRQYEAISKKVGRIIVGWE